MANSVTPYAGSCAAFPIAAGAAALAIAAAAAILPALSRAAPPMFDISRERERTGEPTHKLIPVPALP
jgi:hypothetical protein